MVAAGTWRRMVDSATLKDAYILMRLTEDRSDQNDMVIYDFVQMSVRSRSSCELRAVARNRTKAPALTDKIGHASQEV